MSPVRWRCETLYPEPKLYFIPNPKPEASNPTSFTRDLTDTHCSVALWSAAGTPYALHPRPETRIRIRNPETYTQNPNPKP